MLGHAIPFRSKLKTLQKDLFTHLNYPKGSRKVSQSDTYNKTLLGGTFIVIGFHSLSVVLTIGFFLTVRSCGVKTF